MSDRTLSIIFLLILLFIFLIYGFFLFECWRRQAFIFGKFKPDPVPANAFQPQGKVTLLSADEIARRQEALKCLQESGIENFNRLCADILVAPEVEENPFSK